VVGERLPPGNAEVDRSHHGAQLGAEGTVQAVHGLAERRLGGQTRGRARCEQIQQLRDLRAERPAPRTARTSS